MWHRVPRAFAVGCLLVGSSLGAQTWNDSVTQSLVSRAVQRRSQQLADSVLRDYSAHARGFVTFLAQLGEGRFLPPRVVKADELQLEIYWKAPNQSKQWIVGRRDTLLLPTDISYHRDHLGIVQNNFPDIIRLGDGDEVRDVVHPLSAPGLAAYDFAISDSLQFSIPGRTIDVYEVKVRPRNERGPAAVGAVYLSRDDGQVVRMAFSFTRASLKDPQLEDVSVILENSLIEERYWLPRRQEIEIKRSGSWMDFPVTGIIRGRWEIRDYTVNAGGTIASSPGPEIMYAPAERRARHRFPPTPIVDSLPSDQVVAEVEEVRRVQQEAQRLVRQQALTRARSTLPSARQVSDLVRIDRADGLSLGGGVLQRLGGGVTLAGRARWATAAERVRGSVALGLERASGLQVTLGVGSDTRDLVDVQEVSRVRNSLAAQEFGSDATQLMKVDGLSLAVQAQLNPAWRWSAAIFRERHRELRLLATPARGTFEPLPEVWRARATGALFTIERPRAPWRSNETMLTLRLNARGTRVAPDSVMRATTGVVRVFGAGELQQVVGRGTWVVSIAGGKAFASESLPPQERFRAGGPVTAPSHRFGSLEGRDIALGRVEWRHPVPFPSIPLGRWGRVPASAQIAPYVGAVRAEDTLRPGERATWHGYAGAGLLTLFDVVRFDVARGLRDGRWRFGVDLTKEFWPIL